MAFFFYALAAVAVFSALMVVTRPNAVHSAIWLVLTFFSVAGLFILQEAEFVAAVQVLVYAGGIMVLFLFVIMLVNLGTTAGFVRSKRRLAGAFILSGLTTVLVAVVVGMSGPLPVAADTGTGALAAAGPSLVEGIPVGNLEAVGMSLLTTYLLPFELISLVLLVAVIGAIVLCRRQT